MNHDARVTNSAPANLPPGVPPRSSESLPPNPNASRIPQPLTPRLPIGGQVNSQPPQIPDYELLRCIGQGSYGEVWLARTKLDALRAVKIVYRKTFEDSRPFVREFKGIQKFEPISRSHDGLVDILHVGGNEEYFYYVMELAIAAKPVISIQ